MKNIIQQNISVMLRIFYPMFRKVMPFQVFCYLVCGAINTFLNIILFAVFFHWIINSYTLSLIFAFLITVPAGFWLSKQFTFTESEQRAHKNNWQLLKYFLVVLQGLILDYLIMSALINFLAVYPTVAKCISTVIVLLINYLLQKHYTFKAAQE